MIVEMDVGSFLRQDDRRTVALLQKELDLERIKKELIEVDAFILAITNHKATL
ncbi:hypothetical protein [Flavobacterium sp. HNIBRBA15423]|uniref:hypothetical protein n=1 Tax=Flavobacterium sp. HNIBRBA15423 TaxID=3458683 RepID=UPI004044CAFF